MNRYASASLLMFAKSLVSNRSAIGPSEGLVVASAADGLRIAISAVGDGRSVGVPAYTCGRVVGAVAAAGCRPIFYDVDPEHGGPAQGEVDRVLGAGVGAVVLTHMHGVLPEKTLIVDRLRADRVVVIEDSALVIQSDWLGEPDTDYVAYSFGRGKPLPLGGGGLLLAKSSGLAKAARDGAGAGGGRVLGLPGLMRGLLRDSRLSMELSRRVRQVSRSVDASTEAVESIRPARVSALAERLILAQLHAGPLPVLVSGVRAAIEAYQSVLPTAAVATRSFGDRVPSGTIVPSLAVRVERRDDALCALRAAGLDCPAYWRSAVGEEVTGRQFPGARALAKSLLFLPIHPAVNERVAKKVAAILSTHKVQPFN